MYVSVCVCMCAKDAYEGYVLDVVRQALPGQSSVLPSVRELRLCWPWNSGRCADRLSPDAPNPELGN